jgi:glutaredoxin
MIYIFGYSYCEYYKKAIKYCIDKKIKYKSFDSENIWNFILKFLKKKINDHKTSPIIFNKNVFIGGYDDFIKLNL